MSKSNRPENETTLPHGPGPSTVQTQQQKHQQQTTHYRTAYGPRHRQQISFPLNGRTKQEFQSECDINTIMARFDKTGVLAFTNRFQPQYGDTTGIEFQNSMEIIATGRTMFQELPSSIRERFRNDPGLFLDFVHDERNLEEMRELGLLRPMDAQAIPLPGTPTEPRFGPSEPSLSGSGSSESTRTPAGGAKSPPSGEKTA